MNIILCDCSRELCDAWRKFFKNEDNVKVKNCSFQEVEEYDCIVSPANSFGIMDGGFDGALTNYFGTDLMNNVQRKIAETWCGEQPVGSCMVIYTGNNKHPYCAHAPTMRIPKQIIGTDNIYLAMRAMLLVTKEYPQIKTVVCPGLGTCTGRVNSLTAAHQMYLAYISIMYPKKIMTWKDAVEIDAKVNLWLS